MDDGEAPRRPRHGDVEGPKAGWLLCNHRRRFDKDNRVELEPAGGRHREDRERRVEKAVGLARGERRTVGVWHLELGCQLANEPRGRDDRHLAATDRVALLCRQGGDRDAEVGGAGHLRQHAAVTRRARDHETRGGCGEDRSCHRHHLGRRPVVDGQLDDAGALALREEVQDVVPRSRRGCAARLAEVPDDREGARRHPPGERSPLHGREALGLVHDGMPVEAGTLLHRRRGRRREGSTDAPAQLEEHLLLPRCHHLG